MLLLMFRVSLTLLDCLSSSALKGSPQMILISISVLAQGINKNRYSDLGLVFNCRVGRSKQIKNADVINRIHTQDLVEMLVSTDFLTGSLMESSFTLGSRGTSQLCTSALGSGL